MTRAEMLELRTALQAKAEERRRLGDYDTNAAAIRFSIEASLKLADHLLSRMKGE